MGSNSISLETTTRSALLLQARKGDRESLARLVLPYAPGLYRGALRMTRNAADAEDVPQEAFLKAMSRLAQFSAPGMQAQEQDALRAWASLLCPNASIN